MDNKNHEPVLLKEVLEGLQVEKKAHLKKQAQYIDATLGLGGHAYHIVSEGAKLLGIDTDSENIETARMRLTTACPTPEDTQRCFTIIHGNFRDIDTLAKDAGFEQVDGILMDLGVSSPQLTSKTRGLSFTDPEAVLDMRLDKKTQGVTAADLLNSLNERQLLDLFEPFIGYLKARDIAKGVVRARERSKFAKVSDFLNLMPPKRPGKHIHPATLPFMALRIAVNTELENLKECLPKAVGLLKKGGRLAIISFHSGEDTIVKHFFQGQEKEGNLKIITREVVVPSEDEIEKNPRARSAKLRVSEKL